MINNDYTEQDLNLKIKYENDLINLNNKRLFAENET